MDIEQLSRSQTILLTLLISFVTSIATGIVTVSLMNQAPPTVAQTVNRVIEQTVQQVVPSSQPASAATITQQKTVVVNESDLISQAVTKVSPSIVRLYTSDTDTPTFLGLGVVLAASGTIATDENVLGDAADAVIELSGTSHVHAFVTSRDDASGIAYLAPATSTIEGTTPTWTPMNVSSVNPVLGESVVALSGMTVARIGDGIITSIIPGSATSSPTTIDTSIASASIMSGSPLIDTSGDLLGISTGVSRAASESGFINASVLMDTQIDTQSTPDTSTSGQ